ncbi:hypothetical protein CEP53_001742 [Fusarium sp. AF-6]|nr:hypothetical protein CEP53_001742 [Fusarium sp. AF-6]
MASLSANMTRCAASTFATPTLLGAEFLSIEANFVPNYSFEVPKGWTYSQPALNVQNVTFCNVTVTYTHSGQNDTLHVEAWLPTDGNYNGRLQAPGGSGWTPGRYILTYAGMINAVANGFASVTTDAGIPESPNPVDWLLTSPGNINTNALQNFGQVSLNDEAVIAKSLIKSLYGNAPSYSYWNACSQGGRQGMKLAQQYPSAFDGIIAAAPAINWAEFYINSIWPSFYMEVTQQFPRDCEVNEITSLAITACDKLDGVEDGIIGDVDGCRKKFDPFKQVGKSFNCSTTVCTSAGRENVVFAYQAYVKKDPTATLMNITHKDFDTIFKALKQADQSISPGGTLSYYKQVSDFVGNVTSFYKYYRVPGLGHCWGGNGGQPEALFSQLQVWVENGTEPEYTPAVVTMPDNSTQQQILCPYPQKPLFDDSCTKVNSTTCWSCKD